MSKVDPKLYKHHMYTSITDVAEITKPLKEHCGIDCFAYQSDYLDPDTLQVHRSAVTNSRELIVVSHLYGQQIKDPEYQFYKQFPEKYYLMDITSPKWTEAMTIGCDLHNFIAKVTKIDAHTRRTIMFATKSNDLQYKNFYLQNQDLLNKFISYFMDKANRLVSASHKNSFELPNKVKIHDNFPDSCITHDFEKIMQTMEPKHYELRLGNNRKVKVPAAEMRCLQLLARGRSAKEIGCILNISPRTVETNWSKSKTRLGCYTRKDLLDIVEKNT